MSNDFGYFLLLAVLGLGVGSLLNVVTWRLPIMISDAAPPKFNLWLPVSHCPHCKTAVRWYDNIPIASWLMLKGRCRHCRHGIGWRYPLLEIATLLLTLGVSAILPPTPLLPAALLFSWILLALVVTDAGHQLLPDALTLPLLWLGLLVNLLHCLPLLSLSESVTGAIVGYSALALLAHGYHLLRGKEALGMGDAKLLAAIGAWIGWQPLPLLLLTASIVGIIWALLARCFYQRLLSDPLPFGPFLAGAGFLLFLNANR